MGVLEQIQNKQDRLEALLLTLIETKGDGIGKVFNEREAAEYLGVSIEAIRSRRKNKAIPFVKNDMGHIRYAEIYLKRCELGEKADELQEEMNKRFGIKNTSNIA